jgi:hypothetical protein
LADEIFKRLDVADLAVVDSLPVEGEIWGRPNVYIELGYALGRGMPVLLFEPSNPRHSDLTGIIRERIATPQGTLDTHQQMAVHVATHGPRFLRWIFRRRFEVLRKALPQFLAMHMMAAEGWDRSKVLDGYVAQGGGQSGLRVIVPAVELPSGLVLEIRGIQNTLQDVLIGLAVGWDRNSHGHQQGDVIAASVDALLSFPLDSETEGLKIKLKVWEGNYDDNW